MTRITATSRPKIAPIGEGHYAPDEAAIACYRAFYEARFFAVFSLA